MPSSTASKLSDRSRTSPAKISTAKAAAEMTPNAAKIPNAAKSGSFKIGNFQIHRLGFGAMRVTGPGIWGEPADRAEAIRTLKRLPALGVNFIDTADSYGPDVSEKLIHEALHPYEGMLVATKGGLTRSGPDVWTPRGAPDYLIEEANKSRRQLGVKQIALWQLHRIDPKVPRDEQFAAIKAMLDDGTIANAGLSEVSVADIKAASKVFKVATVQNRYNLVDRTSEDVLDYCETHGIGFIPWYPLAAGDLAKPGSLLDTIAKRHGAMPSQVALAWMLKRSPVMLPIPGTSKVAHLDENVAAVNIALTADEFAALDREGKAQFRK
jgi:aryl-alcohol dehydrogenase-like predicted oxidoreductase